MTRPRSSCRCRWLPALAFALALAAGCDRAVQPFVPGEEPQAPDLSRIFPEGARRSEERESRAQMGRPRMAPPAARASAASPIRGTVTVAPELVERIPPGAILFLMARRGAGGPPLAVQRIADPVFPLRFSIGPEDRMTDAIPFAGPLRLSVWLDSDGNATTHVAGDMRGVSEADHPPGTQGVDIAIDEVL